MFRAARRLVPGVLLVACAPAGEGTGPAATTTAPTSEGGEGPGTGGGAGPTTGGAGSSTGGGGSSSGGTSTGDADTGEPGSSTGAPAPDLPGEVGWRSELYPEDWTPAFTGPDGRFLHDFSYAGYRGGGVPLGQDVPAATIDVVADHDADPSGASDATAALQAAIDEAVAMGGAVVAIPAGLYRVDGTLAVTGSRVVLRGEGPDASRLWFTRFMNMSFASHLTIGAPPTLGEEALLVADGEARASTVTVADAGAFAVGDDVAVGWTISPEFVEEHGMTGTWGPFNGAWQPFFWRTVTAVDGDVLTLDVPLRYPARTRDAASVRKAGGYLREVGVEGLGLANAVGWDDAWAQDQVHVLALAGVADGWVRDVASFPSPGAPPEGFAKDRHLQSSGISVLRAKRVTIADTTLERPEHRGEGGNGYLFEVSQSSEVLIRDCTGRAGRHNFIQNWGFGATGIVWLRIHSLEGVAVAVKDLDFGLVGLSEFHHSLATANLIDQSTLDDGWGAVNRGSYSSGAGHAATQSAIWNPQGSGTIRSRQFGHGYVIGPAEGLNVQTGLGASEAEGTEPEDWVERAPVDANGPLVPASLYEDQLARRLGG